MQYDLITKNKHEQETKLKNLNHTKLIHYHDEARFFLALHLSFGIFILPAIFLIFELLILLNNLLHAGYWFHPKIKKATRRADWG